MSFLGTQNAFKKTLVKDFTNQEKRVHYQSAINTKIRAFILNQQIEKKIGPFTVFPLRF